MKKTLYTFSLIVFSLAFVAQTTSFSVQLSTRNKSCEKGAAAVLISGGKIPYSIQWSTGNVSDPSITELEVGEYSVVVRDSTLKDTTIIFKIEDETCAVLINNHFTPNSDNYNDSWTIINWQFYPEFELYVYNKWGQQVHSQKKTYIPWTGEWLGVTAPDGTYYYVFYFKGGDKNKFLKGDVSILR